MYPTAFPNCLEQSSNKAGMAQRTRRSSPIASPPVPPMTKILMMKMSNSFVRGSSRRPVSAFLLRIYEKVQKNRAQSVTRFYLVVLVLYDSSINFKRLRQSLSAVSANSYSSLEREI